MFIFSMLLPLNEVRGGLDSIEAENGINGDNGCR